MEELKMKQIIREGNITVMNGAEISLVGGGQGGDDSSLSGNMIGGIVATSIGALCCCMGMAACIATCITTNKGANTSLEDNVCSIGGESAGCACNRGNCCRIAGGLIALGITIGGIGSAFFF